MGWCLVLGWIEERWVAPSGVRVPLFLIGTWGLWCFLYLYFRQFLVVFDIHPA